MKTLHILTWFLQALLVTGEAQRRPDFIPNKRPQREPSLSGSYVQCSRGCKCHPQGLPTYVDCSNSNAEIIPHDLPPSVSTLFMDDNGIRRIDSMLSQYNRLTELSLENNNINEVSRDAFHSLRMLTYVNLAGNRFSRVLDYMFRGLTNLRTLILSNNGIEDLDVDSLKHFPNLEELDLSQNRLVRLNPSVFRIANNIQTLSLKGNLFRDPPAQAISHLKHLSVLDLSDNTLSQLPSDSFSDNTRLTELYLRGCTLKSLDPNTLNNLGSLKVLDLSNNRLTYIPGSSFQQLDHLEELRIGLNFIREIKRRDMKPLINLRYLVMNGCDREAPLTLYPDAFSDNRKLVEVNITKCTGLKRIEAGTFSLLPSLELVNFHGCGLERVDVDAIDWSSLRWMDFSFNKFHCDCDLMFLAGIAKVVVDKNEGGVQVPEVRCASPKKYEGVTLAKLNLKEMGCQGGGEKRNGGSGRLSKWWIAGIAAGSAAILLIIIFISIMIFRRKNSRHSSMNDMNCHLFICVNRGQERRRIKRPKNSVLKNDIRVETLKVGDTKGYFDVKQPIESELDDNESANLYEVPIGPSRDNYPDVKLTVL